MTGTYYCPTCGRDYDDAADEEIAKWTARGWCCEYCYMDNLESNDDQNQDEGM